MTILFLALWLQMSAQAVQIPTCQGCWQIWVATPTALDDITRAEFAEAARRAADETDGKPLCTIDAVTHKISPPECAAEPVDVPAVRESLPSVCSFQGFQPMQCTNNGELDWSLAQTRGFIKEGEGVPGKNGHIYKCKDTSRVLLTSEDGKKHCIKF